jgi:L-seryl-tRNA(Ser) seleniumtransferase
MEESRGVWYSGRHFVEGAPEGAPYKGHEVMSDVAKRLRKLPSVDSVLRRRDVAALVKREGRQAVTEAVRKLLEKKRSAILGSPGARGDAGESVSAQEIARVLEERKTPSLAGVVNATGIVIHTNLGRAPLPASSLAYAAQVAGGFCNLEYRIEEGKRGSRYDHIEGVLREMTGAEAAHVVNNNAAALLLAAAALARGREIIVSRGELIEIGDGFRLPDVIEQGGAELVEVGATNRTRPDDFERAVGERTGLILKAHLSNFYMEGFVEEVPIGALVEIARRRAVPLLYDIGSGALELPETLEGAGEPMVRRAVASGADLVTFSGDKLLGGPQAGIIVGRKDVVTTLRRHPMTRALRPCKLTIGLLHHVLLLYSHGRQAEIPVFEMMSRTQAALRREAGALARLLGRTLVRKDWTIEVGQEPSKVGGGSLPRHELTSWVVRLRHTRLKAEEVERRLRLGAVPVICRVKDDAVVVDVRTLAPGEARKVAAALAAAGK